MAVGTLPPDAAVVQESERAERTAGATGALFLPAPAAVFASAGVGGSKLSGFQCDLAAGAGM